MNRPGRPSGSCIIPVNSIDTSARWDSVSEYALELDTFTPVFTIGPVVGSGVVGGGGGGGSEGVGPVTESRFARA